MVIKKPWMTFHDMLFITLCSKGDNLGDSSNLGKNDRFADSPHFSHIVRITSLLIFHSVHSLPIMLRRSLICSVPEISFGTTIVPLSSSFKLSCYHCVPSKSNPSMSTILLKRSYPPLLRTPHSLFTREESGALPLLT